MQAQRAARCFKEAVPPRRKILVAERQKQLQRKSTQEKKTTHDAGGVELGEDLVQLRHSLSCGHHAGRAARASGSALLGLGRGGETGRGAAAYTRRYVKLVKRQREFLKRGWCLV